MAAPKWLREARDAIATRRKSADGIGLEYMDESHSIGCRVFDGLLAAGVSTAWAESRSEAIKTRYDRLATMYAELTGQLRMLDDALEEQEEARQAALSGKSRVPAFRID